MHNNDDADKFEESGSCELEESETNDCVEKDDDPRHRPKHMKGTPVHMQKRHWHVATNEDGQAVGKWVGERPNHSRAGNNGEEES